MSSTFRVYVDESGDEGFNFGGGSSDWFVLSAVLTSTLNDLQTVKLVDSVRTRLGKPDKKPLHFRDLKHEQRLPFIEAIAKARLRTISVLVHKPSIKEPEKFQERFRLYFYSVRYLLERVSWCCRDRGALRGPGDGTAEIFFSNRSGMSYDEMIQYLQRLKAQTGLLDIRIDWSIINPEQIGAFTAGKRMGLQIADAVAGSFFYAVQKSAYGFFEARYAHMLKPVVYHHRGRYLGNGLKFWPRETDSIINTSPDLKWIKEFYK